MKILVVCTLSNTITAFLGPHLVALTQHGHCVDVACSVRRPLTPDLLAAIGTVHDLPLSRSPLRAGNLCALRELYRICRRERYDVVHVHTPVAAFVGRAAAIAARVPFVVYTAHGFHFQNGSSVKSWLTYFPAEWLMSLRTDQLLTMNREDYRRASRYFRHPDVRLINGVGVPRLAPVGRDAVDSVRSELGLQPDDVLLLSVGELSARKAQDLGICALAHLPKHFKLALAGDGPKRREFEDLAHSQQVSDRTHFLGYRTDAAALMGAADVLVHPSRQEGLPVAVMEAMRSSTPVVGANIRGLVDLVGPSVGHLLADRDPEHWAAAIAHAASHPDQFSGGPEALEPYTLDRAVRATVDMYAQIEASLEAGK